MYTNYFWAKFAVGEPGGGGGGGTCGAHYTLTKVRRERQMTLSLPSTGVDTQPWPYNT